MVSRKLDTSTSELSCIHHKATLKPFRIYYEATSDSPQNKSRIQTISDPLTVSIWIKWELGLFECFGWLWPILPHIMVGRKYNKRTYVNLFKLDMLLCQLCLPIFCLMYSLTTPRLKHSLCLMEDRECPFGLFTIGWWAVGTGESQVWLAEFLSLHRAV